MLNIDFKKNFEYENGFYLTATLDRIGKFVTHLDLFRRVSGISGEIVECGVFKGASLSRFIKFRSLLGNVDSKKIIGFDTFGEFPEADFDLDRKQRDAFVGAAGSKSIEREELITYLEKTGLYKNVELIKGDVRETLPQYIKDYPSLRISLLHIDVDLFEPTKACLHYLYPLVSKGGIVVLDDYGAFPGANKAVEEFFAGQKVRFQKLPYSHEITFVDVE